MDKKDEGKGVDNKKLVLVLVVLALLVVALVVGVIVVNNIPRTSINYEEYEREVISATEDCEELKSLYSSGAAPKELAEGAYDKLMAESGDDNVYKVNLALCYIQHIRYHGATFDEVLALLKAIEPYLSTDGDWVDYYDRLVVYYIEEDDWDKARYYAGLRDELVQIDGDDTEWDGETNNYMDENVIEEQEEQ